MNIRLRVILPLAIFGIMVGFFAVGLGLDPSIVPSPLVEKQAPEFELPELFDPDRTITLADFDGQVYLFNVFASWCTACRLEHPLFMAIAEEGEVPIYGLNYKDERSDAIAWLAELGNPYQAIAVDRKGRVGIDWGVYGVPETFLVDKKGVIRYKRIGPFNAEILRDTVLPLVRQLQMEGS